MPYSPELERRIDTAIRSWPMYDKKPFFGGICYLCRGHISFGIYRDFLIVRVGDPEQVNVFLDQNHVRPCDITGRPMKSWVMVEPAAFHEEETLIDWLEVGHSVVEKFPPK